MLSNLNEFNGLIIDSVNTPKCLIVTAVDTTKNNVEKQEFRLFDTIRFMVNVNKGDTVRIKYTQHKKYGRTFNKVKEYEILSKHCSPICIEGTIKNLKNTRANKKKNEVAFTVKDFNESGPVLYCYMDKALSESMWFKKDQNIIMEALPMCSNSEHRSYRILSFWGR